MLMTDLTSIALSMIMPKDRRERIKQMLHIESNCGALAKPDSIKVCSSLINHGPYKSLLDFAKREDPSLGSQP